MEGPSQKLGGVVRDGGAWSLIKGAWPEREKHGLEMEGHCLEMKRHSQNLGDIDKGGGSVREGSRREMGVRSEMGRKGQR